MSETTIDQAPSFSAVGDTTTPLDLSPDDAVFSKSPTSNTDGCEATTTCLQRPGSAFTSNPSNQGRVRTGCLVCRARKIKCDEQRPRCQKCTKSKRSCVYKRGPPPPVPLHSGSDGAEFHQPPQIHSSPPPLANLSPAAQHTDLLSNEQLLSTESASAGPFLPAQTPEEAATAADPASVVLPAPTNNPHHQTVSHRQDTDLNNADSPYARFYNTSLDIYLVTTLDWLGASVQPPRSFSYFIDEVDCPFISPFDRLNWTRLKIHITQLAVQDLTVATAILVTQNLYRVLINGLPISNATSEYQAAVANFQTMVGDDETNFDIILAVAFLLCLCEVILPNEDGPAFCGFNQAFETRLRAWLRSLQISPISLRICTWLQFLHVATKRVGSCGIMSETMFSLLSNNIILVPSLSILDRYADSADAMYDIISAPVFAFYLELQRISNQIQGLSHYRRSRIAPSDQAEVADIAVRLKNDMTTLWDARPGPLRFQPSQLREDLRSTIAEPLITVAGLCTAAYAIETVALRRILGDPPFPSPESGPALRQIREVIEGDWNVRNKNGALNPGYVRPLFLFAIENTQPEETGWAVARLRETTSSPLSRSDFVASLAEALSEAQRTEQRRVTTKYFCCRFFNVPPALI